MTQKFYLHDARSPNMGILPSVLTFDTSLTLGVKSPTEKIEDGTPINRSMDGVPGTLQAVATSPLGGSIQTGLMRRFISLPLANQIIPAGTWVLAGAGDCTVTVTNFVPGCLTVWRPSNGTVVDTIWDDTATLLGTSIGTVNSSEVGDVGNIITKKTTGVANGDVLVFEFWYSKGPAPTQRVFRGYYDGIVDPVDNVSIASAASYLQAPIDLVLADGYSYALEMPLGAYDLEGADPLDRFLLEDGSGIYLEELSATPAIDRITMEDGLGVLITETATRKDRAFLNEDNRGYIYLEDGSGVLLEDDGLFYAIGIDGSGPTIQKFYLRETTSTITGNFLPGLTPVANVSYNNEALSAHINRDMLGTIGTTQTSIDLQTFSPTFQSWWRRWVSPPLAAQHIPNAAWRLSIGGSSDAAFNNRVLTALNWFRPLTGESSTSTGNLILNISFTNLSVTEAALGPSSDFAPAFDLLEGDILVLELLALTNSGTNNNAIYYDGTTEGSATSNAAYLLAPVPLLLAPSRSDRYVTEDGLGVILSEEFDTQPIFRSYDQEATTDSFLLEDSTGLLISEEPIPSIGQAFTQAVAGVLSFTGSALKFVVGSRYSGVLSFTGAALQKAITKNLTTAILSFAGPTNLLKATTKNLVVAVLSFTGSSAQKIIFNKALDAASLTFTGPTNLLLSVGKRVIGTLSFTGPTNLLKAITKGMTGTLSFTGPTNLLKATTKALAAATLSFTGSIVKQTRTILVTGQLSFSGAIATARAFLKALPGTLTFTGPTNLVKAISKNLTVGTLSFTGPTNLLKAISKNLTVGILSFTGAVRKATTSALTAATLSFTGPTNLLKSIGKRLTTGVLSFTGTIASNKAFLWAMAGTLTFTGPTNLLKNITKGLTVAGLSFTGTTIKSTVKQTFTGILSFTGTFVKLPKKALTATLTFTGAHAFNNVFIRALVGATLSFTGAINKSTSKSLVTAVLSFTGPTNLLKSTSKGISGGVSFTGSLLKAIKVSLTTGVLSFTGSITKKTSKFLVTAVLSFTGAFTRATTFTKILVTAVLTFTGPTNLLKSIGKQVTGALSFTGPTNLPKSITKGMTAGLSFTGAVVKKTAKFITGILSFTGGFVAVIPAHFTDFILAAASLSFTGTKSVTVGKLVTGTLSFTGTIRKSTSKFITAILSFTGLTTKTFPRLLTATLTFTGAVTKQTSKRVAGVLSFTGPTNLKKVIGKVLQATLSFTTNLFFPGRFGLAKIGVQLNSQPTEIDIAVTETLPFVVDISNYMQAGDAITAKYASLINASTGNPVTVNWHNPITMSGNFMTIPILGSSLSRGQRYQMTVVFVLSTVKYATFITYLKVVA